MTDNKKNKELTQFVTKFLSNLPEDYLFPEMADQCWLWQGTKRGNGYGAISWGRHNAHQAHRVYYMIFNGDIPEDQVVRHTCDTPLCVNPKHLILGSRSDNSVDSVKRNRHGNQKLNEEAVKVIKWMLKYKPKYGLSAKLARLYNVLPSAIRKIKNGSTWAHVKV